MDKFTAANIGSVRAGRPPLSDWDRRSEKISAAFTFSEKEELEVASSLRGLTVSALMRDSVLSHVRNVETKIANPPDELVHVLAEVASILAAIRRKLDEMDATDDVRVFKQVVIEIYQLIENLPETDWSDSGDSQNI